MADQHIPLNGAYYGPSIPPSRPPPRQRRSRGHSRGCCCCLLSLLCKLILYVIIILGLVALIFWLIVRPNKIKFHVTNIQLHGFNLTSDNILDYNMTVNITVRNPNKKVGIYYDTIEARGYYEGERFDTQYLTPFYQGHKNTSYLNTVFDGQHMVLLNGEDKSDYEEEKSKGVYEIDVKLYLNVRFKIFKVKIGKFKPKIKCGLEVPLTTVDGKKVIAVARDFKTTKCKWVYR